MCHRTRFPFWTTFTVIIGWTPKDHSEPHCFIMGSWLVQVWLTATNPPWGSLCQQKLVCYALRGRTTLYYYSVPIENSQHVRQWECARKPKCICWDLPIRTLSLLTKAEQTDIKPKGKAPKQHTGLMSRCRNPTEWMASIDSRICLPNRSVVLSVKVPLGWLLLRSARFRPWNSQ